MARARTHVANAAKLPDAVGSLIENQLDDHPELRPLYELMTDEQSRVHEGEVHALEHGHFRQSIRYFHAWRIDQLRRRLGDALATVSMLDVGDTDGLMLKHLGKPGLGFNLSPVAIENIRSNGIEAELGDGERMPFDDGAFDVVLCFETLEHVPNPEQLLEELARVTARDGRVFISIPWVPRTFIHARDRSQPVGHQHIIELCRDDFAAVVSHTPLEITYESVCELFGRPRNGRERVIKLLSHREHIVAGVFARFQFFELRHRDR